MRPLNPVAPVSSTRRPVADLVADVALLAVALAAGLGAARLTRTPGAAHVLLPIAACAVTGHVVLSFIRHLRWPDPLPSIIGVVSVALVAVWTLLPRATRDGIPTGTTVRVLLHTFSAAGTVIRANPTPIPATSGVVLCLAAGAGLAAVFARTLWSWQEMRQRGSRRPLVALFPTFGLFCYTALLSSDVDRVTGTALYLATALIFLAVADRPVAVRHRPSWRSGTSAALVMAAVAVGVPVAASPALSGLRLDAIPFNQGGNKPGLNGAGFVGSGTSTGVGALDLIDNLRAVLSAESNQVMFTATTPTPTYWQVATLTRFDGNAWLPDPTTKFAAVGDLQLSPLSLPVLVEPIPTHTFSAHISVNDLRSNLLPAPPSTVAIANAVNVQIEPAVGVVQPFAVSGELTYDAIAGVPLALGPTASPTIAALDTSAPAADLEPYLALPSGIPADVVTLAHQLVAHATTPAAQATALVRYFTQDKRFRYTLSPPAISGTDALSSFLFTTRAGFCQQFAGAYAVLARIDGLPTRLAVGFTTGSTTRRDVYRVTGADAHSWPQVYLGPGAGWVSFEPTPASTDDALGAGVFNGAPTTTAPSKPSVTTSTVVSDKRLGQGVTPAAGAKGLGATTPRATATTPPHSAPWGTIVLIAFGTVALIVAVTVAGPWLWRRRRPRLRRRHFARTSPPRREILARWEQAASVLARTGLGRRPSETLEEHAARLVSRPGPATGPSLFVPPTGLAPSPEAERALRAYQALADLAARASYAPDPCTNTDVAEARRQSDELRAALRRSTPVGQRSGQRSEQRSGGPRP